MHVSSIILDVHGLMLFELIFLAKILERRKEIPSHNIYPIHFFYCVNVTKVIWGVARAKKLSFKECISKKS